VRTSVDDISTQGRNTQGVRLIRLQEGDRLVGLDKIVQIQDDEANEAE
jgi:DNA gyrase subunit A